MLGMKCQKAKCQEWGDRSRSESYQTLKQTEGIAPLSWQISADLADLSCFNSKALQMALWIYASLVNRYRRAIASFYLLRGGLHQSIRARHIRR